MSNEIKDVVDITQIKTDLTFQEEQELQKFVEKDMPGLSSVEDDKIVQIFSMYMKGKSYTELSQHLKIKKPIVLCLSKQNNWYEKKMEYYESIQKNIQERLIQTKIESVNFLADIVGMYHKVLGEKVAHAMATGEKVIEFMDSKELAVYFRALEAMEKQVLKKDNNDNENTRKGPNIFISGNAKTKVSADGNTLEIESGNTADILKNLAELAKANKKS
jgi:hypothetical protein